MKAAKLCRTCAEARFFDTGSSLFWICRRTGEMRSYEDTCSLEEASERETTTLHLKAPTLKNVATPSYPPQPAQSHKATCGRDHPTAGVVTEVRKSLKISLV